VESQAVFVGYKQYIYIYIYIFFFFLFQSEETTFGNSVLDGDRRELSSYQYLISEYPVCLHSKNCCITKMCLMLPYFWIMVWLLTIISN